MTAGVETSAERLDPSRVPAPDRRAPAWMIPLVLLVTAAALSPCLRGDFVYDDIELVARNPWVASFANVSKIFARSMWKAAGSEAAPAAETWQPLTRLVLLIGHRLETGVRSGST